MTVSEILQSFVKFEAAEVWVPAFAGKAGAEVASFDIDLDTCPASSRTLHCRSAKANGVRLDAFTPLALDRRRRFERPVRPAGRYVLARIRRRKRGSFSRR